jgi:hypothetical protein
VALFADKFSAEKIAAMSFEQVRWMGCVGRWVAGWVVAAVVWLAAWLVS